MSRYLVTFFFCCLAALPLTISELLDRQKNFRDFDLLNATYSVECLEKFGFNSKFSLKLSDGEWKSQARPDSESNHSHVWISEFFSADIVPDSPGEELIVQFYCNDGDNGSSFEVQIFDAANHEMIGAPLKELIEYIRPFPSHGEIGLKERVWADIDPHCCPSRYTITKWKWSNEKWNKVSIESWARENNLQNTEEKPPTSQFNLV